MIWLCMLIPVITVLVLLIGFRHKVTWWEYLLVLGIPVIAIFIGKYASIYSQTHFTEYWDSHIVNATYYEDWDEWVHKTCYSEDCTGSGKERRCHTYSWDCSYRDYHYASWVMTDNLGNGYGISQGQFEELCKKWNNRTFRELNRHYYHKDGDAYVTTFNGKLESVVPVCIEHSYENKVKASKADFNFIKVDSSEAKELFKYPTENQFNYNPILGYNDQAASLRLSQYNALNGSAKQLHMMVLVFSGKPMEYGKLQESYWTEGNKNEFILCVGTSGNNHIAWTKVISWTEVQYLKVDVENTVRAMDSLDMMKIVDYMGNTVPKSFVRKQFKDFNYLTIEPTKTAVVVTFIITLLICAGLSFFAIANDADPENIKPLFEYFKRRI